MNISVALANGRRLSLSLRMPVGSPYCLNFMASPATKWRQRSPSIIPSGPSRRATASIAGHKKQATFSRESPVGPKASRVIVANMI
jgi:hypothetical protein